MSYREWPKKLPGLGDRRYGGAIAWTATRQKSTSLWSMEVEITAASEGGKEVAWLEKLLKDLKDQAAVA